MPRSKAKQQLLDLRNQTYAVSDAKVCATCRHWVNVFDDFTGRCQPPALKYRDETDHWKETPANGTCDLWQAKEGE